MGKTEKIVVLSVLSLVVVLFVWSLGGGDESSAAEREPSYGDTENTAAADGADGAAHSAGQGHSASQGHSADQGGGTARLQRGGPLLVSEMAAQAGTDRPAFPLERGGPDGSDADQAGNGTLGDGFVLPDFESSGSDRASRERAGGRRTEAVHMRPGWDLVTTIGLASTVNPDLLTYEVQAGETWTSIARDLYGQESKAALLRHNNEGMDEPEGMINVPAKDELGALGEARIVEVLRGETLWGVAERTLGSGTRWREIYEANEDVVPNPDYVAPGTVLTIPAALESR